MSIDTIKQSIGAAAADLIKNGMTVGLGTGTTAGYFIQSLSQRCKQGLKIRAAASSKQSAQLAERGGIPLVDINQICLLDITVDGADEIDPLKRMIKGGGGALVRERIVASMSRELVVIVDEKKLVPCLGKHPLPIEIIPFALEATVHKLEKLGYRGKWRKNRDHSFYLTENGNYIFDVDFDTLRQDPERDEQAILSLPGVVDTGFFFNLAGRVIIGFLDGQIVIRP